MRLVLLSVALLAAPRLFGEPTATARQVALRAEEAAARPLANTRRQNAETPTMRSDPNDPRAISASALVAANAAGLPQWSAPWSEKLRKNSRDRAAQFAIATADRLSYRLKRADSLYAQVASTGNDQLARQARLFRAHLAANAGKFIHADSLFRNIDRAARLASDTLTALDAILAYSGTVTRTRGANVALADIQSGDALDWSREPALDAAIRCRRSNILSRLGDRDGARSNAREGIAIATRAGLPRLVAACQFMLATEFARTGQTDSLRNPISEAMASQKRLNDLAGFAATKQWAGYYLINLGQVPSALQSLAEAWEASVRAGTRNTSAWIAINRAAIASTFYDAANYTEWLTRADTLMRTVDDSQGLIELARMQFARALRSGDFGTAEKFLKQAESSARLLNEPSITFSMTTARWELALTRGSIEEAAATVRDRRNLIDRFNMTGWNAEVTGDEAEVLLRRGQGDKALPIFERIRATYHPSQRFYQYQNAQHRAAALAEQGKFKLAAQAALDAAETFDNWRASLNDRGLRTLSSQTQRRVGWATSRLNALLSENGETEVAFELTERRRARDLRDRLALAAMLAGAESGKADSTVQSVLTVREIQQSLPDDQTALIMMELGEDGVRGTAFVLTRQALTAYPLPTSNNVAPRIRRLVALLEAGRDANVESRALGNLLLSPMLPRLDSARINRLVFLPEGVLHRLPFDVLKLADGRFVAQRFETSVAPSATILARLASQTKTTAGTSTLALADANVASASGTPGDSRLLESLFGGVRLMPRLRGARDEVASVKRSLPAAEIRTGADATESEIKSSAGRYDVLHFATHAIVDEWSGANAALALSPGNGEDGMFSSSEIARLRLSASLVVLSACRTIGGEVIAGEGVRGLTGAFLQAGARSVIATSWRVNDRDVVPVVTSLYQQLAKSQPVGTALREAKLAAIRRNVPPSVWGAFTLVGDPWRVIVSAP